jgi:hypothetical protein
METEEIFRYTESPSLDDFKKEPLYSVKKIFRIGRSDLTMFFDKRNLAKPDNFGESKESLNILKICGYTPGLL